MVRFYSCYVVSMALAWTWQLGSASALVSIDFETTSMEKNQRQNYGKTKSLPRGSRRNVENTDRRRRLKPGRPPFKAPSKGKKPKLTLMPTGSPTQSNTARPSTAKIPVSSPPTTSPTSATPNAASIVSFYNASIRVSVASSMTTNEAADLLIGIWEPLSIDVVNQVANQLELKLTTDESGIDTMTSINCQDESNDQSCFQTTAYVSGEIVGYGSVQRSRILKDVAKISHTIESKIESKGYEELEQAMNSMCKDDLICFMRNTSEKSKKRYISIGAGIFVAGLTAAGLAMRKIASMNESRDRIRVHFPIPVAPSEDEEILEVASLKSW